MSGEWSPEVWARADALFAAALDLPSEEREGFLREACGGDAELQSAVEELLATDATAEEEGFLSHPARVTWEPLWEAASSGSESARGDGREGIDRSGERLGAYRLEEEIGRGGMASVYRARRVDGTFDQEVAVKIVRPSLAADRLVQRLRAEREILSGLDHPNIARILDGGTTADGLPYLVMELVEGRPITACCEERDLPVEERLELFLEVLDAVEHAHRRLVLHRDLKPSNILVTDEGRVRLLDFGIAKLMDTQGSASPTLTRPGTGPLTPDYASPEQIRGDEVTTASDVYQLGVLLYRLLAGRRPYRLPADSPTAMLRALEEREVDPPGEAAAAERGGDGGTGGSPVAPDRLRGDLDTIVRKAMREEPDERYASIEAFAEDLRRHLEGRPVRARPPRWSYRARKFLGRNRWFAPAAAAALLALGGYGWTLQSHAAELERERNVARAEAAKAEQVRDFLITVFEGSDPEETLGETVTARDLLDRGVAHADSVLAGQPALRAEMLGTLGRIRASLGFYEEAAPLLERAVALGRASFGTDAPELAEIVSSLAYAKKQTKGAAATLPLHRDAVVLRRTADPVDTARLVSDLGDLALALRDAGRPDSAAAVLREALELAEVAPGEESPEHTKLLGTYGSVLRAQGRPEEAEGVYRSVLARQRARPQTPRSDLSVTLNNLAYLLRRRGAYDEAAELYSEALGLVADVYGPGHPHAERVRSNLGGALWAGGDRAQAIRVAREQVGVLVDRWEEGHWRIGRAHSALGKMLVLDGRPGEGLPHLRSAVEQYATRLGSDHVWTALARAWVEAAELLDGDRRAGGKLERLRSEIARVADDPGADVHLSGSIGALADGLDARGFGGRARAWRELIGG